ncbi:MAG: YHS domain-containing protein [Bacillota bacterium]|nr:YHS domain-containing protein [Bacillota bacterium]
MAKDPVCHMEVREDVPFRSEYEGRTYYFCCRGCKVAFDRDPRRYTEGGGETHEKGH